MLPPTSDANDALAGHIAGYAIATRTFEILTGSLNPRRGRSLFSHFEGVVAVKSFVYGDGIRRECHDTCKDSLATFNEDIDGTQAGIRGRS